MREDKRGSAVGVNPGRPSGKYLVICAAVVLLAVIAAAAIYTWKGGKNPAHAPAELAQSVLPEPLTPQRLAIQKVEEDRGEPTGNKADVEIPAEMKLYKDRRRFLAIQVAEWRRQRYEIPHDFAELASMMRRGEFERLPNLARDYILYGVGLKANDELTHYEQKTGKSVPLFQGHAEAQKEVEGLSKLIEESETKALELKDELAKLKKGERARRREILDQAADARKQAAAMKAKRDSISSYYRSEERRRLMEGEYRELAELSRSFGGLSFDLNDPASRKAFKAGLLSSLRAPARALLEEIAAMYREKFQRPLPVTSLVRTTEYQRQLGEAGNPNAIRIDVPPHTTGLAFDIYTYYMAADEQQFLMEQLSRMEREGRLEALRENRFHIHVFAFAGPGPPDEKLIRESLNLKAPKEGDESE